MPRYNRAPKSRPSIPYGADMTRYRPGIKNDRRANEEARQANFDALPEAEKQKQRDEWAQYQADMEQWRKIFDTEGAEAAGAWLSARRPMGNTTGQQRDVEKSVDTEARIAVEGNTAMDDVPFGESGE